MAGSRYCESLLRVGSWQVMAGELNLKAIKLMLMMMSEGGETGREGEGGSPPLSRTGAEIIRVDERGCAAAGLGGQGGRKFRVCPLP